MQRCKAGEIADTTSELSAENAAKNPSTYSDDPTLCEDLGARRARIRALRHVNFGTRWERRDGDARGSHGAGSEFRDTL